MSAEQYDEIIGYAEQANYGEAAEKLRQVGDEKLAAEFERLSELVGNYAEMVSGALGHVISNYEDRLLDDLARKSRVIAAESEGDTAE